MHFLLGVGRRGQHVRKQSRYETMVQQIRDRNIWLVNATILTVGIAYGMGISVITPFLLQHGYDALDIRALAVVWGMGIILFSLPMDALIRRFSARRMLVVSIVMYGAAVALFPHAVEDFALAGAVRFLDGMGSVGIWICCETIVLSRAEAAHKALVTTLYAIATALGYVIGSPLAKGVVDLSSWEAAFHVAGVIALAIAVVVFLRLDPDREPEVTSRGEPAAQSSHWQILWRIKTSCLGTFAYGYFQVSMVLFLPAYLIAEKGTPGSDTILIPGFFALGMLLFTIPAGRLGDRFGHLLVMRVLASLGTFTILGFIFLPSFWMMCGAAVCAGATLAAISPISLALQGVIVDPRNYSRSNAIYNVFYAGGMVIGPIVSSAILARHGGANMLYHLGAMWAVFVAFTVVFWRDDPATANEPGLPPPFAPSSQG
ncbi:MAG: MFS transporter [Myxococcota bacterium]